jgi:Uma2 family endonuclease
MGTKTLLTVEQFMQLPQYLDQDNPRRYELDEGEVIEMASATFRHNFIGKQILVPLWRFLGETNLGEALYETEVRLDTHTLYQPDIVYWDAAHVATIDKARTPVWIIPQFVVEVVSPSNSHRELLRRAVKYQRAGVHTVWIVNDDPLEVQVFEPSRRRIVCAGEKLELPGLLPGFSMDVSKLLPPA